MAQIVPGVCRGCIRDVIGERGVSLRSTTVRELFEECTRLRLPDLLTDRCSQLICAGCYKHCKEWKSFKTLCQDNEHFYWPMQNLSGKETNDQVLDGSDAGELNLLLEEEDAETEEQDDEDDNLLAILQGDLEEENEQGTTGVQFRGIKLENEEPRIATGGSLNSSRSELINEIRAFLNSGECDDEVIEIEDDESPVQNDLPSDEKKYEAAHSIDCEIGGKRRNEENNLTEILLETKSRAKEDTVDEEDGKILFQRRADFKKQEQNSLESDNIPNADEPNNNTIDAVDLELVVHNGTKEQTCTTFLPTDKNLAEVKKKPESDDNQNTDEQNTGKKETNDTVAPVPQIHDGETADISSSTSTPQTINLVSSDDEQKAMDEDEMFEIPVNSEFGAEERGKEGESTPTVDLTNVQETGQTQGKDRQVQGNQSDTLELDTVEYWVCPACDANLIDSEMYRDHLQWHLEEDKKAPQKPVTSPMQESKPEPPKPRKRKAEETTTQLETRAAGDVPKKKNILKWDCPLCTVSLPSDRLDFYAHFELTHKLIETDQTCSLCPTRKVHRNVYQHLFQAHVNRFKCMFCSENCKSFNELKRHNVQNHNMADQLRRYRSCPLCEEFLKFGGLQQHLMKKHQVTDETTACPSCAAQFHDFVGVTKHILSFHTTKWICSICKDRFYSVATFNDHSKRHKRRTTIRTSAHSPIKVPDRNPTKTPAHSPIKPPAHSPIKIPAPQPTASQRTQSKPSSQGNPLTTTPKKTDQATTHKIQSAITVANPQEQPQRIQRVITVPQEGQPVISSNEVSPKIEVIPSLTRQIPCLVSVREHIQCPLCSMQFDNWQWYNAHYNYVHNCP